MWLLRKIWSISLIPFLITIGLIIQGLKMEKVSRTIQQDTVAIYCGLLMTEIGETIYPHHPGCAFSNFTIFEQEYNHAIHPLVTQLIEKDTQQGVEFSIPPAKKRKKIKHTSSHIVCLTVNQMWKMTDQVDFNEYCNHAAQDRSLYTKFMEQILMEGNIKWRFHDEYTDICMINNVDRDSGVIKHNSFAHVTYTTDVSGTNYTEIVHVIFMNFIQTTAHQQNPIWPVEDIVLDTSFTGPPLSIFQRPFTECIHNSSQSTC